jgi:hypothetical protein
LTTEKNRLREAYGTTPRIAVNHGLGYMMITTQCPQPDCLVELGDLQRHYEGDINRLDFAFEARPDPLMSPDEQMRWIRAHLMMKHRDAGPILEIKNDNDPDRNGAYFVPHAHTGQSPRDVCMYTRASKLNPSIPRVARFELRLRTKESFGTPYRQREGYYPVIDDMQQVIHCHPDDIAMRHLKFVEFDMGEFERKLFRDATKDRTGEEARRLITHYKRSWNRPEHQFGYAQRIHDWYPRFEMIDASHLVELPMKLTWGAVRRSLTDKRRKTA